MALKENANGPTDGAGEAVKWTEGGLLATVTVVGVPGPTPERLWPALSTKITFETVNDWGPLLPVNSSKLTLAKRVFADNDTAVAGAIKVKKTVIWPLPPELCTDDEPNALFAFSSPAQLTVPAVVWAPKRTVLTAPSG